MAWQIAIEFEKKRGYYSRYLSVITRGAPREKFEHKIMKALDELEKRFVVEEYTATNIRIRLVKDSW